VKLIFYFISEIQCTLPTRSSDSAVLALASAAAVPLFEHG